MVTITPIPDSTLQKAGITSSGIVNKSTVGQASTPTIPTPLLPKVDATKAIPATVIGSNTASASTIPTATDNTQTYKAATANAMTALGNTYDPKTGMYSSGVNAGATPTTPAPMATPVETQTTTTDIYGNVKSLINGNTPTQSLADLYASKQNTPEYLANQKQVRDLSAQLAGINAEAQANALAQVGTGGTAAITGAKQSRIERERAIRALPISAQLQAAQGNLDAANKQIETLVNLTSQDQQLAYKQKSDQIDYAMKFADAEQAAKLQEQKSKLEAEQAKQKEFSDLRQTYIDSAIKNGDYKTASALATVTDNAGLKQITAGMTQNIPQDTQVVKLDDGTSILINSKTGQTIKSLGGATGGSQANATKQLETVNTIDNILNNPAFADTFGITNIINRNTPGSEAAYLKGQVETFISQLALAARGQMKGQGAVSDFEGKLLRDAQTALKLNLNPEQARQELIQARGAIRTSSGLPAKVELFKDGKSLGFVESTTAGIDQARKDGLSVKYVE